MTRGSAHTDTKPHPTAKTEAAEQQRLARKFRGKKIDGGLNIALFSAALIVSSRAESGTAKIETQYRNAQRVERLRHLVNDFVVQRAAEQWMRMADDRGQVRNARMLGSPEDGLQAGRLGPFKKRVWEA